MKKKLIKVMIGEAYDKDTKKSFPVYKTFWQEGDKYVAREIGFVNEVEVKDKKVDA